MNEELSKIRDVIGYNEELKKYQRIPERELLDYLYHMNSNMTQLDNMTRSLNYNKEDFIRILTENVYLILKMFSDMNVFPGYFFRKIFEMNAKYYERKKDYDSKDDTIRVKSGMRGDYRFFNETNLSAWVAGEIRNGLNNGYHHVQAYPKTNISDAFLEILALFQKYDIPYKINNKEECRKAFSDIGINYSNISGLLLNSNTDYEDIEYLCRLLFEFISLFVAIGVNPKKYLDAYIEEQIKEKHK